MLATHYLLLVKIHMGPTNSCGSHINLAALFYILTNKRDCVGMCVKERAASIILKTKT
jgi:hypothetical protein